MRDVPELLDAIDLVIARGHGVVSRAILQTADQLAGEIRERRGFLGETLVLAVAGGTGTGKSSLVNALAGEVITSVSVLRPHTDEPFAVIPENPEPAVTVLLDTLGIAYRHEHAAFTRTAIIDLPDLDSIADWHRERVEDLIPRVDGVIWLFDPDKYRDPIVHDQFLSQLAEHRSQFIFALNKIDSGLTTCRRSARISSTRWPPMVTPGPRSLRWPRTRRERHHAASSCSGNT